MTYEVLRNSLQKLIGYYTNPQFSEELMQARREFFDNTGSLDENNPNYSLRMQQFYEWYFLTRPLNSYMKTPVSVCDQHRDLRLSAEDMATIELLQKSHFHTVFEYLKSKNDVIYLRDLVSQKKFQVMQGQLIFGFDSKEYFQARVVQIGAQFHFLNSFCFHPESAQKFILSEVKNLQKNPDLSLEKLLLRLNKMRYKFEQYKHVKPELIYANENKLGL